VPHPGATPGPAWAGGAPGEILRLWLSRLFVGEAPGDFGGVAGIVGLRSRGRGSRPAPGAFFALRGGFAALSGASCGDSVGILTIAAGACVIFVPRFLRFRRQEGRRWRWGVRPDRDSNAGPTA
jgi:hypothetical protein